jgi:hypothetical protein
VKDWVSAGTDDDKIVLDLIRCTECPDNMGDWSYECFGDMYDAENFSEAADSIYIATEAGYAFLAMELLTILLVIMLAERIFYYIIKSDFGHPYIVYALPVAIFFCHFLGMVAWFVETEADWTSD